jgi:hypothetical protein
MLCMTALHLSFSWHQRCVLRPFSSNWLTHRNILVHCLQDERTGLEKELDEMQNQLEDDIDSEIENMKRMYEDKLAVSRETTLKYKGSNCVAVPVPLLFTVLCVE